MIAWLIAFATLVALDLAWAVYTASVSDGSHPAKPAAWAVLLYALGGVATIGWTQDHWLLVPACAGAFAGTYIGAWWNRRKNNEISRAS